jgi:hypothetical protein
MREGNRSGLNSVAAKVIATHVIEQECGLTLPSRGQLPAYGLQLPLMSNVRETLNKCYCLFS